MPTRNKEKYCCQLHTYICCYFLFTIGTINEADVIICPPKKMIAQIIIGQKFSFHENNFFLVTLPKYTVETEINVNLSGSQSITTYTAYCSDWFFHTTVVR